MTNQRDQTKLIIQRFDNYITGANTNANSVTNNKIGV